MAQPSSGGRAAPNRLFAPAQRLGLAVLVAVAVAASMIFLAAHQPWMGLRLSFDPQAGGAVVRAASGPAAEVPVGAVLTGLSGPAGRVDFEADDFVYEPDGSLATFANYEDFLDRQGRLSQIQAGAQLTLHAADGRAWTLAPAPARPLTSLPPDFWVQVFVGVAAFIVSAAIWGFRSGDTSARYLLLSGAATLVFAPFAAVYSTRELSLPSGLFRVLNDGNFLGGSLFAASLAALLLYYPRKLAPRWAGLAIVGVFLVWFAAQQIGLFSDMTLARRLLVMIALLATFALAGVHWWLTRKDPIARAALQWFLLSWLVGVSVFGLGVLLPQMFGVDTSALQGYGFLLFLLVYGGLAFGVMRFRLFELGEWWGQVMSWAVSLMLLALLDLLFLTGLQLSSGLSLSLALLITGVLWLPFRAWLWGRVLPSRRVDERAAFQDVAEIGLLRDPGRQAERWRDLLQGLFQPLEVTAGPALATPAIGEDGLALLAPGVAGADGVRLAYAQSGRRLFGPRDLELVADLSSLLGHVMEGRSAYVTGAAAERRRIARDMHDNLGAQLLSALHSPEQTRKDWLIREALGDLRSLINDAADPGSLEEALADLRHETAERLAACGIALEWPLAEGTCTQAAPGLVHTLRSIVREAVSNVIKHARARLVKVEVDHAGPMLRLCVEDDGDGFDPQASAAGQGLANMQARAQAQGGRALWTAPNGVGGARLEVELPLAPSA